MQRFFYLTNLAEQLMLLFYLFARSGGFCRQIKNSQHFKAEVYDTLKVMICFNDLR